MGITVVLEDERGVALGTVEDPTNLLHRLLPNKDDGSFVVLRFIDRYGDTVINHLQLPVFFKEWDRIGQHAHTEPEKSLVLQVRELAARAQHEQHRYLKFYGD